MHVIHVIGQVARRARHNLKVPGSNPSCTGAFPIQFTHMMVKFTHVLVKFTHVMVKYTDMISRTQVKFNNDACR